MKTYPSSASILALLLFVGDADWTTRADAQTAPFITLAPVDIGFWGQGIATTDGSGWAMGFNNAGQHADGSIPDCSTPIQIAAGVTSVWAGTHRFSWAETAAQATGLSGHEFSIHANTNDGGQAHLLEFAFRNRPERSDAGVPWSDHVAMANNADFQPPTLTHRRNKNSSLPFSDEHSGDPQTWVPADRVSIVTDQNPDGDGLVAEGSVAALLFLRPQSTSP